METTGSQHKMTTCNIKLNSIGNIFVSVTTHWYLLTKLGQLVNPDEDTNLYVSELSSIACGRFYSQYIEVDSGTIWSQYSSVVCEVMVDIDNIPDVISSVTRANISNNTTSGISEKYYSISYNKIVHVFVLLSMHMF